MSTTHDIQAAVQSPLRGAPTLTFSYIWLLGYGFGMLSDVLLSVGFGSLAKLWQVLLREVAKAKDAIQALWSTSYQARREVRGKLLGKSCFGYWDSFVIGWSKMQQDEPPLAAEESVRETTQASVSEQKSVGMEHALNQEGQITGFQRKGMAEFLRAYFFAKYMQCDNVPCKIEQGLYLGSIGAAYNKAALMHLNVTHILVVANSVETPFPREFKYLRIDVLDSPTVNLLEYFSTCFSFIDEGRKDGGSVLVHCFAGKSRSVTVVVGYLMKRYAWTLSQALALVKAKRPQASPNNGFMLQLHSFEDQLRGAEREMTAATSDERAITLYRELLLGIE